jgi:superfamily I DNA/RNA helicase
MHRRSSVSPSRTARTEAQDLHPEEWRLIRAIVPRGTNDLFIVGDAHQRIYARKVVLGQCGIDIRGRSRKLRINYRTTAPLARSSAGQSRSSRPVRRPRRRRG